jgi:phosphoribosyl-ATP pyrophosphohydrolase/phosphoribosyl-AMP cyclohydrolase
LVRELKLDDKGLIPVIIQDEQSGEVLMLGYMNEESLELTLSSGEVWFYSRSRKELWHKGATSGNRLIVREVWLDCDRDTVLVKARPMGSVCHTGERTCFFQKLPEKEK